MSTPQRHIIGRITLEIETPQSTETWALQEALSRLLQQQAVCEIEQLFDQWVGANEVVRIDELALDLPPLDPDCVSDEFVPQLLMSLRQALAQHMPRQFSQLTSPGSQANNLQTDSPEMDAIAFYRDQNSIIQNASAQAAQIREIATPDTRLPDAHLPDISLPDARIPDISLPDPSVPDPSVLDLSSQNNLSQNNLGQNAIAQSLVDQDVTRQNSVTQRSRTQSAAGQSDFLTHTASSSDWESFLYFLDYGRLPWWQETLTLSVWIARWEAVIRGNPFDWGRSLQPRLNQPTAYQRLVAQFPTAFLHLLIAQMRPAWTTWPRHLEDTQALLQQLVETTAFPRSTSGSTSSSTSPAFALQLNRSTAQYLEQQAWRSLFSILPSSAELTEPFPLHQWLCAWLPHLITALESQRRFLPSASTVAVRSLIDNSHMAAPRLSNIADKTIWLTALDSLATSTRAASAATIAPTSRTPEPSSNTIEPLSNAAEPFSDATDLAPAVVNPAAVAQAHPLIAKPPKPAIAPRLSPSEQTNGIYLNNAGLVLLHPFLKIYFEDIGLLTNHTFRHEHAQQQAIALLHYLATQQLGPPEYELVLPKLLCGWPLDDPPIGELTLPETALAEGEKLLQAAINYWDALKNTTPDGLREGFLQRQGKLARTENNDWKLWVEQQSIDILLSRLPWGLSMIKLPWMPELLSVEWT